MDQLSDAPPLPDAHERAFIQKPDGRHAVVSCVPRNCGTSDRPDYKLFYFVHDRNGTSPYDRTQIKRWWDSVDRWMPTEAEKGHLSLVADNAITYAQAMAAIDLLADADHHARKNPHIAEKAEAQT